MAKPNYRSPKYSRINLESALRKAAILISIASDSSVKESEIAKFLGYAGLTGRSIAVLSAMKKYKILESEGSGLKLTDAAMDVLKPDATALERSNFVERAAYAPALFSDVFEKFEGQLPSDSEFNEYLAAHQFNPASFDQIIKIFRQNYQLVENYKIAAISEHNENRLSSDYSQEEFKLLETDSTVPLADAKSTGEITAQTVDVEPSSHEMNFTLSEKTEAKILLYGNILASDIEKLIKYLDVYKDNFPAE